MLGAAFKPNSDDIRDSPALNVAAQLQLQGAVVRVTDPSAVENSRRQWPQLDYAATAEEAAEGADAVLVLTEWQEYRDLDPIAFGRMVPAEAGPRRTQRPQPDRVDRCRLGLPGTGPPRGLGVQLPAGDGDAGVGGVAVQRLHRDVDQRELGSRSRSAGSSKVCVPACAMPSGTMSTTRRSISQTS